MTDKELKTLKDNLWHAADVLRSGAHLAANKYGQPILGLIFLRYADILFKQQHSKSGSPHGLVGSNPTASANEKSSNHAGFWIFLFTPSPSFCPPFGLFFPKVRKELCAIFSPFLRFDPTGCRSGPPAAERSRSPWPAPRKASTYSPDGRRCLPWWKSHCAPAIPESA